MTITAVRPDGVAGGNSPAVPAPAWCPNDCPVDDADGSVFHMSKPEEVPASRLRGVLDVCLTRIDDEDKPGETTVTLSTGFDADADLSPEQALRLAEVLRDHALRAAYPGGVEMPVERVRLGDELLTPDGWQVVEIVDVDGWLIEDHPAAVSVNTDAHGDDDQALKFKLGTAVRVRRAVS